LIVSDDTEASEKIMKFKRILVTHIENRILNAQKKFEESMHEELE
jgi:hypothetical protein